MSIVKGLRAMLDTLFTPAAQAAAGDSVWVGRDESRNSWSADRLSGGWVLKKNGTEWARCEERTAADSHVELATGDVLVRLYADRMTVSAPGGGDPWMTLAKGGWQHS